MAAARKNLLSLHHLTGTETNYYRKHRKSGAKDSSVIQLEQQWLELRDRELRAQQHNMQLLQQFDKAQDTLREMLASQAAMKTIRVEYERYIQENYHRWQQEIQEKRQAAWRKKTKESLRFSQNEAEEMVSQSAVHEPLPGSALDSSISSPRQLFQSEHIRDTCSQPPDPQPTWLTHTQSYQHLPGLPPSLPPPHSPLCPHIPLVPHVSQDAAGGASPQLDKPSALCAAGIPPQLHRGENAGLVVSQADKREGEVGRVGGPGEVPEAAGHRGHLSPELDIKPVRLSCSHAESSDSSGHSWPPGTEKRKKRAKTKHLFSGSEKSSSQKSSSNAAAKSPEASFSLEEDTMRNEKSTKRGRELNQLARHVSGNLWDRTHDEMSESCTPEEIVPNSIKAENKAEEEPDEQESNTAEQSSTGEKSGKGEQDPGSGDEDDEEHSKKSEDEDGEDEALARKSATEEETEEEMKKQNSASSKEEDGNKSSKENTEDDKAAHDEGTEHESGEDSIISPQENRSKHIHVIHEEEDEERDTRSSEDYSDEESDEDEVEDLLAPQQHPNKEDADGEPKASSHDVSIFQVTAARTNKDPKSDSDDFYD